MSFTIGIDASRNRSGGAKTHIIGIINELDTLKHNIAKVPRLELQRINNYFTKQKIG